jgi:3-isopropylmalate dehydratase
MGLTLYDKIYQQHLVDPGNKTAPLQYIDAHLIFEAPTPVAFDSLRKASRPVRRPDLTLATVDHNVPTSNRSQYKNATTFVKDPLSRQQIGLLQKNTAEHKIKYLNMSDRRQGIVHVVGPEQGLTLPGSVLFCGDSHTPTHGAVGALAISGSVSDITHVLATQTVLQKKYENFQVCIEGELGPGVYSKDIILYLLGKIGSAGGTGCVIEFCGSTIRNLSMEARMVLCNMSIESGARSGLIAPDAVTFEYLKGRPLVPSGDNWEKAVTHWKTLYSDDDSNWDINIEIEASDIVPYVTWGTSPDDVIPITGKTPDPADLENPFKADAVRRSLQYMGLQPNTLAVDITIDRVFIGSCTNARIEDLRAAARVVKNRHVAKSVYAMVVPGSGLVRQQAEKEGLDKIFKDAGFDWREAGCSMCLAMNGDMLAPGERCASTTNRNFENRQGPGGRTFLVSPVMAAAAAIKGHLADVREFLNSENGSISQTRFTLDGEEVKSYGRIKEVTFPQPSDDIAKSNSKRPLDAIAEANANRPSEDAKKNGAGIPKFDVVASIAAPFEMQNINTDLIISVADMKVTSPLGLGPALFRPLRYNSETGKENPDFILNQEPYRKSQILVCTGENFGCGSSREKAVWALTGFGFRCVIAPSFASIFFNNCGKCGILAIAFKNPETLGKIHAAGVAKIGIQVDLPSQEIRYSNSGEVIAKFEVDPYTKHCLLDGLDDVTNTLVNEEGKIYTFEKKQKAAFPWLFDRIQKLQPPKNLSLDLPGALDVLDW